MLIVLVICSASLYSQTARFPVGTFIGDDISGNKEQLDSLGVDIIVQSIYSNYDYWKKYNIIAANEKIDDYIHLYTCAAYNVFRSKDSISSTYLPGIKHEIGRESGGCWETQDNDSINKYLVTGPDYFQRAKYQKTIPNYKYQPINYQVDFQMKIEGNTTAKVPVCELSVYNNDDSTVLASRVLLAKDLSNSFAKYSLTYIINREGNDNKKDCPDNTDEGYKPQGTSFRIKWLGNRKLIADSIVVYDNQLGAYFADPSKLDTLIRQVKSYDLSYQGKDKIKYWWSLDEPTTNDNYYPYRFVDSLLQVTGPRRLITELYPQWNGERNYENTIQRFMTLAKPERLMFWYFPFWKNYPSDSAFKVQREVFQRPFDLNLNLGSYYYVAQGAGYYDTSCYREYPTTKQLLANTMLALAHGAKGILYWTYYSVKYTGTNDYYRKGIVDVKDNNNYYPHLPLWDILHDNIIPRLHGSLGDNLLKLNYSGEWLHNNNTNFTFAGKTIPFVSFNNSEIATSFDYHTGLFYDSENNNYLMNVNLITNSSAAPRVLKLDITNPTSFRNLRLKNIESGLDTTLGSTMFTLRDTLQSGDGHLFSLLPVLKYGGKLIYSDTVKTSLTLNDIMTIYPNVTLTINNSYTVNKNITLKQNSAISIINSGKLIISDSAKINIASWTNSPVKAQTLQYHPRIFWGQYNSDFPVKYRVYKQAFGNIQLLTDTLTQLSYTDITENINSGPLAGHTVSYHISAVEDLEGEYLIHNSNTVNYDIAGNWADKKQQNELNNGLKYNLCQNYPNPFNPETKINYSLAEDGLATIKIYDILGNEIITLLNEQKVKGNYSITFNINKLKNITSGVYFYTIRAGNFSSAKKMIILK
jgi:hypothetical protein